MAEHLTLSNVIPDPVIIFYYQNDHLGTPQRLLDKSGSVVWQAQYTAFGLAEVSVSDVVSNLRFPGQYYDQESGLHYNYFRDYDPELGRYIQSDPIGLNGGINTYGYANQNPIMYTDPTGEVAIWGSITSIASGYLLSKVQGCDYSMSDALRDGALGFVGAGLLSKANKIERIYRARKLAKNRGLTRNPNSSSYVEEYVGPGSKKSRELIAIKHSKAVNAKGKHSQYPRVEWRTGKNQWKNP